ncbi:Uncharacterised protein [Mycobacterium tuberculosis]|nr:Uncharacterised protein [Mycobacterium tuberculosis]
MTIPPDLTTVIVDTAGTDEAAARQGTNSIASMTAGGWDTNDAVHELVEEHS